MIYQYSEASKSEFCENFKKQVLKLNQFLQLWSKEAKTTDSSKGLLLSKLVIEFSPEHKRVLDFEAEFAEYEFEGSLQLKKAV